VTESHKEKEIVMIKGIAASAGVAVSKVFKLQHPELNVERLENQDVETELKRLNDAIEAAKKDITSIKEKAVGKIRSMKDDFVDGLQTADDITDMASMVNDMEEMGFTKSKMAGSFLAGGVKSYFGKKIGSRIGDEKKFKEGAFKFKNAINNPSKYVDGLAQDVGDKDIIGSQTLSNFLYTISDMFKPNDPRTLATFRKDDPDTAAIFNFRTQNSITTVIPNLLSKIYGEVKSIRTGDGNPEGNEVTWNNDKDKFETLSQAASGVTSNIKKKVSDKMGYHLTKAMDKLDPNKELSSEESSTVLSSLVKYLGETKDTSTIGLVEGKNSFLNYLPDTSSVLSIPSSSIILLLPVAYIFLASVCKFGIDCAIVFNMLLTSEYS
jgi:hypothetical protein